MKRKIVIAMMLALCLCLSACAPRSTNDDISSPSSSTSETADGESSSRPVPDNEAPENVSSQEVQQENEDVSSPFHVDDSPFFDISFDKIGKIYFYDASMGEEQVITAPELVEQLTSQWKNLQFSDEAPAPDPAKSGLSRECLYYFEFYENVEDNTPIFCAGLDPFYVKIEEEKFGPYKLNSDEVISDILNTVN